MARKATNKKTVARAAPRGKSAKLLEERHIGTETVNWSEVTDFETAFRDTLRHYSYFYDTKTMFKWASDWVKKNLGTAKLKSFKEAEPWRLSSTAASMCKMALNGAVFDERRQKFMLDKINEVIEAGKAKVAEKKAEAKATTNIVRKTPADLVKENTSNFIAEVEGVLDDWENAPEDYSVFAELQKVEAAYNTAKAVAEYYTPIRDEIALLVSKKDKDLLEAYESMPIRKRKKYLTFLETIVSDAEKYMATKKAVRKPRKKKTVSAGAQVAKVQYLKDSAEFKVASIDPSNIVGATEVWLFNVKYRTMSKLVTSSGAGFSVKGTTIQDVDLEASGKKKLRKPDAFFAEVSTSTKAKLNKVYDAIKTKPSATTGRINSDTIIFKAFK